MGIARFTQEFLNEFNALDNSIKPIAEKRIQKIIANPKSGKELHGEPGLYRERFLKYRIIYQLRGDEVWFLKLKKREHAYD